MTNAQAKEILEHLTNELVGNGFGEVVWGVNTSMEASVDEFNPNISYNEERYKFRYCDPDSLDSNFIFIST